MEDTSSTYDTGAEFDVGTHCHLETCKQLDFLPFVCDGCSHVFCLHHHEKYAHNCSGLKNVNNDHINETVSTPVSYSCSFDGCLSSELVPVVCSLCHQQHCLRHRLPEDHACSALPPKRLENLPVFQPKPVELKSRKVKSIKASKMAAKLALMKLKLHSKGDQGLPDNERVYFSVYVQNLQSIPQSLFVSSKWTIGKALDYMCHHLKLQNNNDKSSDLKLKLCCESTGDAIRTDVTVQSVLDNALLFNGSSVVIALLKSNIDNYL